jgi:serine/threonine protein phosphatase PrpC
MGKTIGPTEDVWKPADLDVPELDVTLSPLTTPGSALAAENPYLTAEPEVTTVHVKPGDFVVLGTKGLFECLSDEEIVGLVGVWVEERRRHPELRQ